MYILLHTLNIYSKLYSCNSDKVAAHLSTQLQNFFQPIINSEELQSQK